MRKKIERPPDDKKQSQRFVETARQLETDEKGKAFYRTLQKLSIKKKRQTTSG